VALLRNISTTLEMIKWEHSFLTLPFGLTGAVLAARGVPGGRQLFWICVALVAARSAAMAFNRLADHSIDAGNPRTATRALPAGTLSRQFVMWFIVVSAAVLIFSAAQLSMLAFYLSPIALAIVMFYSYTKRFTRWSHLVLGFAMGIAPAAAWVALQNELDPRILILTAAVMFWGGGFDILYSCQDFEHDSRAGLHSVPRFFGIQRALILARLFHVIVIGLLLWLVVAFGLGKIAFAGVFLTALLLAYEHSLVRHDDLSKLNAAFFTTNGFISVLFLFFVTADLVFRGHA
jgi:4-hydroxybenzoate polyprenyltransferase